MPEQPSREKVAAVINALHNGMDVLRKRNVDAFMHSVNGIVDTMNTARKSGKRLHELVPESEAVMDYAQALLGAARTAAAVHEYEQTLLASLERGMGAAGLDFGHIKRAFGDECNG